MLGSHCTVSIRLKEYWIENHKSLRMKMKNIIQICTNLIVHLDLSELKTQNPFNHTDHPHIYWNEVMNDGLERKWILVVWKGDRYAQNCEKTTEWKRNKWINHVLCIPHGVFVIIISSSCMKVLGMRRGRLIVLH